MSQKSEYQHNHYVPEWYQKRFLMPGQSKYWHLDLAPERITRNGRSWKRNDLMHWGPVSCFAQDDLYTTNWGNIPNRDIEKFFFGKLDNDAKSAVEHFSDFDLCDESHDAFNALLPYLSAQKLRTPKGLRHLEILYGSNSRNFTLRLLQQVHQIYCAIWTECVWQIADASDASVKFIISDHPVTVYNRECFPLSQHCRGLNDPDIRMIGTHTFYPLCLDKILILTNLSWVRDPYQNALKFRPNPEFFRSTIFNLLEIQTDRKLSDEEVIEINYITKRRAHRYIAGAEKEWLYPERHLRSDDWRRLGDGYLLMPDPRHIHGGGEVTVGYEGGHSEAYSEYGHRPWQKDFKNLDRERREWAAMSRFKAEWASMFGPEYRGQIYRMGSGNQVRQSQGYYEREVAKDVEYRKRPGEARRRAKLRRPRIDGK